MLIETAVVYMYDRCADHPLLFISRDLTDNDIQRLEDEAFRGLPNLKSM